MSNPSLSAIILAGGKSSRMGQDKALIEIAGVPLLRRVCDVAMACTDFVYVVTAWTERYRSLLPETVNFVPESVPRSPILAFAETLPHTQTDWVLLLACDLPRLNRETLQEWIAQLNSVPDDAIAFVSKGSEGWDPLCAFYRRSCLSSLNDYLATGERSFQHWLDRATVQELTVSDRQVLANCNSPEDLAAILDSM